MAVAPMPEQPIARQHGAMDHSIPPVDLDVVRMYRLGRVREQLIKRGFAGIVLIDQLNTRYATDSTNMQVWCMHNETRYVFVPAEGPVVLWDYARCEHMSDGLPTIDEVRPCFGLNFFTSGNRLEERTKQFAQQIADLVKQHGGGNKRLALDRGGAHIVHGLEAEGLSVQEGMELMEVAREIKSPGEMILMRHAVDACEKAVDHMRAALRPGITENALWAKLHEMNVELGGEWIETRLLSSGPRTNPWMKEASMRVIERGDIVSFDTDLVGPYGYMCDMSRAWVCGEDKGTDEQRRLYGLAMEQIEFNKALIKPGMTLWEIAEKAWPIPDEFIGNRYSSIMHGVGLCDEWPTIKHQYDIERGAGYDGVIQEGMCVCVESLIGSAGGREAVKLEDQFYVGPNGLEPLSSYPFEESLM